MKTVKWRFILSLTLGAVLLVGVNMLVKETAYSARIDLTDAQIFTISQATRDTLADIDEPLRVQFFFSRDLAAGLPVFQSYADRIKGLLKQYEAISDGNITVEFLHPKPFTPVEDRAVAQGLQGIPVDQAGNKFYFGLSVENATDDRGVIPFFDPARGQFLEYELTRLIDKVANPGKPTVGIISSLPLKGGGAQPMSLASLKPWAILEQLKEEFQVEMLASDTDVIPSNIDMLLLAHPADLREDSLYAIDQYAMRGGNMLVFLDSHLQLPDASQTESSLEPLLSQWGVTMPQGRVAAEKDAAMYVQSGDQLSRLQAFPKVTWLEMGQDYFAEDSIVTATLEKLRFIESGFFEQEGESQVDFHPLVTTTPAATTIDSETLKNKTPETSLQLYRNYVPEGEPLVLAARLSGKPRSAFSGQEQDENHIEVAQAMMNTIIVGDSDMLRDDFWVERRSFMGSDLLRSVTDNGRFVLNAVEFLTGHESLISLRSRGTKERRFTVLDELKRDAEIAYREEEARLQGKLDDMEKRLRQLQKDDGQGKQLFADEEAEEIQQFRNLFLETRRQLRRVQQQLRENIEQLSTTLALINLGAVPLLVLILAFIMPAWLRKQSP